EDGPAAAKVLGRPLGPQPALYGPQGGRGPAAAGPAGHGRRPAAPCEFGQVANATRGGVVIYFIQDTVTRAIKIGYSTNPQKRLKHLQNSNQNKLVLLYAMHGELEHEAELLQ